MLCPCKYLDTYWLLVFTLHKLGVQTYVCMHVFPKCSKLYMGKDNVQAQTLGKIMVAICSNYMLNKLSAEKL